MNLYKHRVQYYETDQMNCVHHSNYIRWFEEARQDLLEQIGIGCKYMEECGIICPVLSVSADYNQMTRYYDEVFIEVKITYYNSIRIAFSYVVSDTATGEVKCKGTSKHCFLDTNGTPMSLKRNYPNIDKVMKNYYDSNKDN